MFSFLRCKLASVAVIVALFAFGIVATHAQTITGSISGAITDANGGVIPGATVTLTSEKTGQLRGSITNSEGRFNFPALQPGTYALKVERQGFQTLEQRGVILSANENLALGDLKLQPGQVSETVSVVSEGAIVERESSDLTARLTADQINLISTKGRDVTSLLRLLPGTSNNDDIEGAGDGFGTDLPNISGQRGRSTVPTIDGLFAGEPSGSNKLSMTINQDAVAEVKVLRNNYGAEYGNNGGAIINIVSKGGGKDYAGSVYYFLRNESLNGSPFFNNKARLKRPLYRHLYPGGNYGGPMPLPKFGEGGNFWLKDKAFFFFAYEKPHQITPNDPRFVTVPTALERVGDFSQSVNSNGQQVFIRDPLNPGTGCSATDQSGCFRDPSRGNRINVIPQSRWNASGVALLNYFPLPNTFGGTGGSAFNYVFQSPTDVPKRSMVLRFDVKPSNADTIYWKYQWWTSDNLGTGTSGWPGNDNNRWGINSHYLYKDDGWSTNWVRVISSSLVNEFNFGMRHDSEGFIPGDGEIERLQRDALNYTAPQLFPQNNRLGTIPRVTNWGGVRGPSNGVANINWLDRWGEVGNDYIKPSFADNVTITHGDHSLKFGVYYERLRNGEAPGGQWSGVFNFAGNDNNFTNPLGNTGYAYANAIVGNFRSYQEATARPFTNLRLTQVQWYAADQWKMNRRFTVNYGLRFGYHSPFEQIDGQGSNFVPSLFDPSKAVALYEPFCASNANPKPVPCPANLRRALDPTTGQTFALVGSNANLIGAIVPKTGDPNNGLALGSDADTPRGFRTTRPIDIEPRLGFAWDLFGDSKTVLRVHAGMYHAARVGGGTTGGNLVNNQPANRTFTIDFGNINDLQNLIGTAINTVSTINAVEQDSHTPTVYNFTLGLQREIGFKTVLEVSYVGSFARHLGQRININEIPDGAKLGTNNISPVTGSRLPDSFLRPYRGYGDINMVTWGGTSNYNSLQVQANRRYTRGFQAGLAYTYSKSFDYANDDSSDISFGRPYKAFNYAPSDFDQTHILTVNYIYDVPALSRKFGNNGFVSAILDNWQISGTTSYASGKPKNVTVTYSSTTATISINSPCPDGSTTTSTNASTGTKVCTPISDWTGGGINARMFMACDPQSGNLGFDSTGTPLAFNPACFAKPTALGQIGNQPRNNVRMPSIFNNDLAFFKNIKLDEKRTLQLRWEIYNIFNHTNFRDIDAAATWGLVVNNPSTANPKAACSATNLCTASVRQTNARFGAVTAARTPRVMQASIRFEF